MPLRGRFFYFFIFVKQSHKVEASMTNKIRDFAFVIMNNNE